MRTAVLVAILSWMIGSARADDLVEAPKPIQIPPEELRVALQTFGDIEGLRLVFLSEDVEKRDTHGVNGRFTCPQALEQLLRGTDLTFRFFDPKTVMILPISVVDGVPVEPRSTSGLGDENGKIVVASVEDAARLPLVTITATKPSDASRLEYYRSLAKMSRSDYKRTVETLPFVKSGIVKFPEERMKLGQHIQSAVLDGMVLWRVFKLTPTRAESQLQVHNSNSVPVFVELDFGKADLGKGAYAALAPGETAIWSSPPTICVPFLPLGLVDGCGDYFYKIWAATVHVQMLKGWMPER